MRDLRDRAPALAMALLLSLFSTTFPAQGALPRQPGCQPVELAGSIAPAGGSELACLSGARRTELLGLPVAAGLIPPLIPPLARELELQGALHRWKALEAEALAVPKTDRPDALAAYLQGRRLEALRSDALKETEAAIVEAQARILKLGMDFRAATRLATRWIHRQPGRGVPAEYLERIMIAADAILWEDTALKARYEVRDTLNRHFDEQLERVLTMEG